MISENNQPSRTSNMVSVELPESWLWKESYTLFPEDGRCNVIASSEHLGTPMTSEEYADVQGKLLGEEFPEYEEHRLEPVLIDGADSAFLREFAWSPPDGERVRQIQLYAVVDNRGVTATATALEHQFGEVGDQLRRVLLSLVVSTQ